MSLESSPEIIDATQLISGILCQYPSGSILKELLQNSDDSGATSQTFILDSQLHRNESIIDPSLAGSQGPALLAVNNSKFEESDWVALRTIHGSNKDADERKTGKFGLGFRATYHLTDNPHVLSGDRLYIADPHRRFQSPYTGGVSIPITLSGRYPDQFAAFESAVVDVKSDVNMTVVRLPLRTSRQAQTSKIKTSRGCTESTSAGAVRALFNSFIEDELKIILLFLKNITYIELKEVGSNGITTFGKASLTKRSDSEQVTTNIRNHESTTFLADYTTWNDAQSAKQTLWRIYRRTYSRGYAMEVLHQAQKIERTVKQIDEDLKPHKLIAGIGMAYCLSPASSTNGRLFTLLPLPQSISPRIPIHLDCNFALTPDRQHLLNMDDNTTQGHIERLLSLWNKVIFDEFVPRTWAALLEYLTQDLKTEHRLNDIWSIIPLEIADNTSERRYWENVLSRVLGVITQDDLKIFPIIGETEPQSLRGAYLLNTENMAQCPQSIFAKLGLRIIAAPSQAYKHLHSNTTRFVSPSTMSRELRDRLPALSKLSPQEKVKLFKYLMLAIQSDRDVVHGLPLIPLVSGEWISMDPLTRLHVTEGLTDDSVDAWTKLGIPFLDKDISYDALREFGVTLSQDTGFFLRKISVASFSRLNMQAWEAIKSSLVKCGRNSTLEPTDKDIFKQLLIFPIHDSVSEKTAGERCGADRAHLGPIRGAHYFVHQLGSCPIPRLQHDTTFIDSNIDNGLRTLLDNAPYSNALKELDLLQMALDNWDEQPNHLREKFLPLILGRLGHMPSIYVKKFRDLPFVPVGDRLVPPSDVIDPNSTLADLYDSEDYPTDPFGPGSDLLDLCREHDLLCRSLTPKVMLDRIHWIERHIPSSMCKANRLMSVLEDLEWRSGFDDVVDECRELAWIPTTSGTLENRGSCFYNDYRNFREGSGRFGRPVSDAISLHLARRLKIPVLSDCLASTEDDDDDNQNAMTVDLLPRICAVLNDYDLHYGINEFLANAHDAGATEFSITLYEAGCSLGQEERTLSPSFENILSCPGLIIYNNKRFRDADFRGILQIDRGGKLEDSAVIGRYGVGALSLFHFTDVVTIISGDQVLFMDPTGENLPRTQSGQKRTALRRSIQSLSRDYPSQLRPFDGKHGFTLDSDSHLYDGTMFWLPLYQESSSFKSRTRIDSTRCRLIIEEYQSLAHSACFFTGFKRISAQLETVEGDSKTLWRIEAKRGARQDRGVHLHKLTIEPAETWFVTETRVDVPKERQGQLPHRLKVHASVTVKMAFPEKLTGGDFHLFSVLQLPCPILAPCHLSAPFSLLSNRRGIHLDPSRDDDHGKATNDTRWNRWLLSEVFPPFWLSSLLAMKQEPVSNLHQYFPTRESDQDISQVILNGFYSHLPQFDQPIISTTNGKWVTCTGGLFLPELPTGVKRRSVKNFLKCLHVDRIVFLPSTSRKHLGLAPFGSSQQGLSIISDVMLRNIVHDFRSSIEQLYRDNELETEELTSVLHLLLSSTVEISHLPLLLVGQGENPDLIRFPHRLTSRTLWYATNRDVRTALAHLVPSNRLLHHSTPRECIQLMSERNPPVAVEFDETQVTKLAEEHLREVSVDTHNEDTMRWVSGLGELLYIFEKENKPVKSHLLDYPLIPTQQIGKYVSLRACTVGGQVLPYDDVTVGPELMDALHQYGFNLIDVNSPSNSWAFSSTKFPSRIKLSLVLKGLEALKKTGEKFRVAGYKVLATWIRDAFDKARDCRAFYSILRELPIWPSIHEQEDEDSRLYSASSGCYLPLEVDDLDDQLLMNFWDGSSGIFRPEHRLSISCLTLTPLTLQALFAGLNIPSVLPRSQLRNYARLVRQICKFPDFSRNRALLRLPDGSRKLRPAEELYDSTVPPFLDAFARDSDVKFIHHSIRSSLERIDQLDLIRTITTTALLDCLNAIHAAAEIPTIEHDEIENQVRRTYDQFTRHVPRLCQVNYHPSNNYERPLKTSDITSLRFIIRDEKRSPHEGFNDDRSIGQICGLHLPMIICPERMVRPEFENVAWTQRGRLGFTPPQTLLNVMPSFGEPEVHDVVQHLRALVKLLHQHNHHRNQYLLHDLRETYKWLNKAAMDNKDMDALNGLREYSDEDLFLNVEDPEVKEEEWRWNHAGELFLNQPTSHDTEGVYGVRGFLKQFRPLLLCAGCKEMKAPSYDTSTTQTIPKLPASFNEMRLAGRRTDMQLSPLKEGKVACHTPRLHFHSTVLEAMVPHIREAFESDFSEGTDDPGPGSDLYDIPATPYGAEKFLEFVYTKSITIEEDGDLDEVMDDLLELLEVGDQWYIEELKTEIGRVLVKDLNLPDFKRFKLIRDGAQKYRATSLLQACQDFERDNAESIAYLEKRGAT